MTWYLTIRSDAAHARFTATTALVEFLCGLPELRPTSPIGFESETWRPWVAVLLAVSSPAGDYVSDGAYPPEVNVVELACSHSFDAWWYESLAGRIAEFLGWSAFEEHEGRRVWPPAVS